MRPSPVISLLILLLSSQASGQIALRTMARPAKLLTRKQVWTLNKKYTDPQHGVTFRYPSIWQRGSISYLPPVLYDGSLKPRVTFGYDTGGFPREGAARPYTKTNLEGVGISYAAIPVDNAAACHKQFMAILKASPFSSMHSHGSLNIGGHTFDAYTSGDAGMNQWLAAKLYSTCASHTCFVFETDIAGINTHGDGLEYLHELTQAQITNMEKRLQSIVKSVRIKPTQ